MKFTKKGDLGTPQQRLNGNYSYEIINEQLVARVKRITAYHLMHSKRYITSPQFYAADKLRIDYDIGVVGCNSFEVKERTQGGMPMDITDKRIYHSDKYYKAINSLNSKERALIIHVVINDKTPTSRLQKDSVNKKKMKEFKLALTKLARYYGFVSPA